MKFHDGGIISKLDNLSFHYCDKEHWEFNEELDFDKFGPPIEDPPDDIHTIDIWSDCKDYKEKIQ
jgi:hypothetical protein